MHSRSKEALTFVSIKDCINVDFYYKSSIVFQLIFVKPRHNSAHTAYERLFF